MPRSRQSGALDDHEIARCLVAARAMPLKSREELLERVEAPVRRILGMRSEDDEPNFDYIVEDARRVAHAMEANTEQMRQYAADAGVLLRKLDRVVGELTATTKALGIWAVHRANGHDEVDGDLLQASMALLYYEGNYDDESVDILGDRRVAVFNAIRDFKIDLDKIAADKSPRGAPSKYSKQFFVLRMCEVFAFHAGKFPPMYWPNLDLNIDQHRDFVDFMVAAAAIAGFGLGGLDDILKGLKRGKPWIPPHRELAYEHHLARLASEGKGSGSGYPLELPSFFRSHHIARFLGEYEGVELKSHERFKLALGKKLRRAGMIMPVASDS